MDMEELAYTLNTNVGQQVTYTVVEYGSTDTFDFMPNGGNVRRAEKQNGTWVQVSGDTTESEVLHKLGNLMEDHHFYNKSGQNN